MSNVTYPSDPWTGYDNGNQPQYPWTDGVDYNTPQVYNTREAALTLTPPMSAYTSSITLDATEQDAFGAYEFCTPFTVNATFYNALPSEMGNLRVGVVLRSGVEVDETFQPLVEVNGSAAVPYNGSISYSLLRDTAFISVGSAFNMTDVGDNIVVRFKLKPVCGFQPGNIILELSAAEGCGKRQAHIGATPIVNIAGTGSSTPPFIQVSSATINAQDALGGVASVPYKNDTDGIINLVAGYDWILYGSNALQAFVDVPADISLVSGTLVRNGTTYNVSFAEVPQGDPNIRRLAANYQALDDGDFGGNVIPFTATLTLKLNNPARWDCATEESIRVWAGVSSNFVCEGNTCTVYSQLVDAETKFTVDKMSLSFTDVTASGKYQSATQEAITFAGSITNANLAAYPGGDVKVELFLDNDFDGTLSAGDVAATNAPSFIVSGVSANSDIAFSETFNIRNYEVCKLMLVMRKSQNGFLCEDIVLPLTAFDYAPVVTDYDVCSEEEVTVGDLAITGYTYAWTPAANLNAGNIARPVFTAPVATTNTAYPLELTVSRPDGCTSTSTVTVNVRRQPVINPVTDFTYCTGEEAPLYLFVGTGNPAGSTTYDWVCTSPAAIGLSALSGTNTLPAFTATNSGSTALTASYEVTPSVTVSGKTCTGAPETFQITVNPKLVLTGKAIAPACAGTAVNLSDGIVPQAGVTLEFVDASYISVSSPVTLTVPGTYTYYAKGTVTATGCHHRYHTRQHPYHSRPDRRLYLCRRRLADERFSYGRGHINLSMEKRRYQCGD